MSKKSKQKRTRVLIITTVDTPDWVSEEFTRFLASLPPHSHCEAATENINDVDLEQIQSQKPEWLLVYCPVQAHEWVVSELLMWLELHPRIHRHIIYEKIKENKDESEGGHKTSTPFENPDYILADFCRQFVPQKRPS
jgi:hypothetical protein